MSSFLTLSLRVIPNSLLWILWWAASIFFICVTDSGLHFYCYLMFLPTEVSRLSAELTGVAGHVTLNGQGRNPEMFEA